MPYELTFDKVRRVADPGLLHHVSSEEVPSPEGIVGQDGAVRARLCMHEPDSEKDVREILGRMDEDIWVRWWDWNTRSMGACMMVAAYCILYLRRRATPFLPFTSP